MDYPQDFPAESRAKVEAARIRAGRQFDSKRAKVKWKSDIEVLFWTYVLTPFLVFAEESARLGLWPADEMDKKCRESLRLLTIDAYYQKGKGAGVWDMISNWNGGILWEAAQKMEKTSQWRKYENILLNFAVKGKPVTQSAVQNTDKTAQRVGKKATNADTAIGRNIDRLRKECGWSLDKLAKETGIDKKSILSHLNKGTRPVPRILKEYAQAFSKELGRTIIAPDLEM
jgi:hypothetical protein